MIKKQSSELKRQDRFLKHFNKWFPGTNDMVNFDDRFKLVRKGDEGVYSPGDLVARYSDYSDLLGPPGAGEDYKLQRSLSYQWNTESVVFKHPRLSYEYDWPHFCDGSIPSAYNLRTSLDNSAASPQDHVKAECALLSDRYNWSELEQYQRDTECLRYPVGRGCRANWLGDRDMQRNHRSFNAASSCLVSQKKLYDVFRRPSFLERCETKEAGKIASYVFYDTMRRGVFFHLYPYDDYTQIYNTRYADRSSVLSGISEPTAEQDITGLFWRELENNSIGDQLEIGRKDLSDRLRVEKFPFLIVLRAESSADAYPAEYGRRNGTKQQIEATQFKAFSSNLAAQYMRLFEIWLTAKFKSGNQLQYTIVEDIQPMKDYGGIVPTVDLKLINLM
jgi:hypothetical protein